MTIEKRKKDPNDDEKVKFCFSYYLSEGRKNKKKLTQRHLITLEEGYYPIIK